MENQYWWQKGVVYQIYPRSFMDSNHDGIGDLQGIINCLDYLNDGTPFSLGVDIIWLSPIYPSPMADFGYDVADYCNIDPIFGDLKTFDRLVEEVHKRGMKIIIDWVPNHTSNLHPWFTESRSSLNNKYRNWYIWRDAKSDGSPPNNWGSFFGGPAWTFDNETKQYYLHQFVKEQPELNWRNPDLEQAMYETLRFWLKRNVDGFRMDVVGLIIKDETFKDNPINLEADQNLPPNDLFNRLVQKYNMDQDDVHQYIRRIRNVLDEFDDRVGIGELWGPIHRWVKYYGDKSDELNLPFNFRLMDLPFVAKSIRASIEEMEATLPHFAWPNYVLSNHDHMRLASRFGGEPQARLAAMLLLTLRGTPTLYYGDELGMPDTEIPFERMVDPQGINLGKAYSRDGCRTPMQWNSGPYAGFSSVEPWLPLPGNFLQRTVSQQNLDNYSILNLYRHLIWFRQNSLALTAGTYSSLNTNSENVFSFLRKIGDYCLIVILNFSNEILKVKLPINGKGDVKLSTHLDRDEQVQLSSINLREYEGIILSIPSTDLR